MYAPRKTTAAVARGPTAAEGVAQTRRVGQASQGQVKRGRLTYMFRRLIPGAGGLSDLRVAEGLRRGFGIS
jgi:hypothetical protein